MLLNIYLFVLVASFIIGVTLRKTLTRGNGMRYLLLLLGVTVLIETIGYLNLKVYNQTYHLPFAIYHPVQIFLITKFFLAIIKNEVTRSYTSFFNWVIIVFLAIYEVVHRIYGSSTYYENLVIAIFVVVCCILYLRQLLNDDIDLSVQHNPNFWIISGMLTFFAGSFLVMGLVNSIYNANPLLARQVFSINHLLNIFYYGSIGFAFYLQWKSKKSLPY